MILIRVILIQSTEIDETGASVMKDIAKPATPIPANAVRVACDGQFYTVYESGD